MVAPPAPPILGLYETGGAFPGAPSAWASGPTTNLAASYMAWGQDIATYVEPFVAKCNSNGIVPFVELEAWNSGPSWNVTPLFSDITGGTWDSWLTQLGTYIASTSKACILTFAHEMNVSGQYPWSAGDTGSGPGGGALTAAEWVAGWKYVHDKVNSTANGYAVWMWACSAYTGGTTISPAPYWPGSSYVDMVGIDGYPDTKYGQVLGTFAGQLQPTVSVIRGLGWTQPVYISETNLAQMVASGGESITSFVADMYNAGVSGVLEFEDAAWNEPIMSAAQWAQYNNEVASLYGTSGGGGGGGSGGYSYSQALIDAFGGTALNSSLWITPISTNGISVSGGKLLIQGLTNFEQVVVETTPYTHNLANGIFALQLSQSGTPDPGTMWFLGICDNYVSAGGNAYEFQTFPGNGSGSWYAWAFAGTTVSGDTGNQNILGMATWNNGDWLGIGDYNLHGTNDVHVYKSSDARNWTEIASWTVTGAVNEAAAGFYFGTNYNPGAGSSTYLATIDNVSWFTRSAAVSVSAGLLMAGVI